MRVIYNNLLTENSVLTPSSEVTGYEWSYVVDQPLADQGAFDGNSGTLVVDLLSAVNPKAVIVGGYNGTSNITVEANSSDSWGSPAYSHAMTVYEGWNYNTGVLFLDETYRYWRLVFSDSLGENLAIGRLLFPSSFLQMPEMDPKMQYEFRTTSKRQISRGRQTRGVLGLQYFSEKFKLPKITSYARTLNGKSLSTTSDLLAWWQTCENWKQFCVLLWEDQLTEVAPFFGVFQDDSWKPLWNENHDSMSVEFGIEETL